MTLSAVDEQMPAVKVGLCDAVTAVKDEKGQVQLLGVKKCGYSPSLNDNEAVINSHFIREAGWQVDCTSERHGGGQCMNLPSGVKVMMNYDATTYKMFLACRSPSETELKTLSIQWIECHIEDLEIDDGSKPIRRRPVQNQTKLIDPSKEPAVNPELVAKDDSLVGDLEENSNHKSSQVNSKTKTSDVLKDSWIDWKKTLGHCTEEVARKTIKNTTQYFAKPVAAETRAYPMQHRQRRLFPLHLKRLQGRTCGDTFFSSLRSIRGYTCVQLFVALYADYIWVKMLRRESQVPGAYQDFVRDVGTPNELLTDNSKVQSGEKFKKINRDNLTQHNFSTPHCQNQNPAERKIQDVKHRGILVLFLSKAPLVFWCYAIYFVVECLNHTSKPKLDGLTPVGVLNNNTPDISVFRFQFWAPIEYLDPHAKFPACKWKPGRFVGIARNHGDPLTYRIWTTPDDGGWKKGRELIRNVVRHGKDTPMDDSGACTWAAIDEFVLVPSRDRSTIDDIIAKRKKKRKRVDDNFDKMKRSMMENGVSIQEGKSTKSVHFATEIATPFSDNLDLEEQQEGAELDTSDHEHEDMYADDFDSTSEVYDELDPNERKDKHSFVVAILKHRWKDSGLQLQFQTNTDDVQWVSFRDAKEDYPKKTAEYIMSKYESRSRNKGRDRILAWAKKTTRDIERAVKRITRLYDFVLDDNDNVCRVRRAVRAKKKNKKFKPRSKNFKYGVQVPRTIAEALELDAANGNNHWQEAIDKEMKALLDMECFEFLKDGESPGQDFQKTRLHMIFDVKNDLRRKARLVAGGHLVDLFDTEIYSSTVKGISVKLLHVIAHKVGLKALCGDVGNAFVTAFTTEKVYCIAGLEFGEEHVGKVVVLKKALYGLASSSACFHAHFADVLRSFGFHATRFDQDVWYRRSQDKKYYEYVCTHVDDFCIFSKEPQPIMDQIKSIFTVKSEGPPSYYLGNDFVQNKKSKLWYLGCKTYIKEGIARVEGLLGKQLSKHDTPMAAGDHPELDDSQILNDEDHTKYQMLIGMLNWIVTIGRLDIAFATSSLSRFVACPRKGHLDRALYVFGYLKKRPNRRIRIDSRDPIIVENGAETQLDIDYQQKFHDQYPDAEESLDDKVPKPILDELQITAYVDSDHAHDKATRRSITGLIIFVGRTPVLYFSKRQGAIET